MTNIIKIHINFNHFECEITSWIYLFFTPLTISGISIKKTGCKPAYYSLFIEAESLKFK